MKRQATSRNRRYKYAKVSDNRKHPIRGLWMRNGKFVARITTEDEAGRKAVKWVPLAAGTAAEAQEQFRTLQVERTENRLRHIGLSPKFAKYLDDTYLPLLAGSGKKPGTLTTEKAHYDRWRTGVGHLRLDKIRPSHIAEVLNELRAKRSPRTCNLALVCLRHVLKAAKRDGYIKTLPTEDIAWQRTETKARTLYALADIEQICKAGMTASKNGQQLSDFLRFLAFSGAREQEALRVGWNDVDSDHGLLTIGADGDTKNREARRVDFNPQLEAHLKSMRSRRVPDSDWLFPSPQRGERDKRAKTFRESLLLTRAASGWNCQDCKIPIFANETPKACPQCQSERLEVKEQALPQALQRFGFHDCRHHFISYAVMSGIDFMTIARWVGHKDGGILIGKVYGHLSNEHAKAQGARLSFGPSVVSLPEPVTA